MSWDKDNPKTIEQKQQNQAKTLLINHRLIKVERGQINILLVTRVLCVSPEVHNRFRHCGQSLEFVETMNEATLRLTLITLNYTDFKIIHHNLGRQHVILGVMYQRTRINSKS